MPTVAELRLQISTLQGTLKELESQERAERDRIHREREPVRRAFRENPAIYEFEAKPSANDSWTEVPGSYSISKRIKPEMLEIFKSVNGFDYFEDNGQNNWAGMRYFRTYDSLLCSCSGGTVILNTKIHCSDEEWALIIKGEVPHKFV